LGQKFQGNDFWEEALVWCGDLYNIQQVINKLTFSTLYLFMRKYKPEGLALSGELSFVGKSSF